MNNGIVLWLPGNLGPCTELAELVVLISYILFASRKYTYFIPPSAAFLFIEIVLLIKD